MLCARSWLVSRTSAGRCGVDQLKVESVRTSMKPSVCSCSCLLIARQVGVNCGPTTNGVQNLPGWLAEHGPEPWDVIHFNHGLHDLDVKGWGWPQVRLISRTYNAICLEFFCNTLPGNIDFSQPSFPKMLQCSPNGLVCTDMVGD